MPPKITSEIRSCDEANWSLDADFRLQQAKT